MGGPRTTSDKHDSTRQHAELADRRAGLLNVVVHLDRHLYQHTHTHTRTQWVARWCGSVAEWLACWTQAQKGPGSNRSRDAVG